ncbi:40S ribosomal protein S7, partial [Batrachochytrium salamandrivorans]
MSARSKILKPVGVQPDELELQVAQNLFDLEHNVAELKADLRGLQFNRCQGGRCHLRPCSSGQTVPQGSGTLVRELEKKFSDFHVLFVAQRRILRKPDHKARVTQKRPHSRTLTSVHERSSRILFTPPRLLASAP